MPRSTAPTAPTPPSRSPPPVCMAHCHSRRTRPAAGTAPRSRQSAASPPARVASRRRRTSPSNRSTRTTRRPRSPPLQRREESRCVEVFLLTPSSNRQLCWDLTNRLWCVCVREEAIFGIRKKTTAPKHPPLATKLAAAALEFRERPLESLQQLSCGFRFEWSLIVPETETSVWSGCRESGGDMGVTDRR